MDRLEALKKFREQCKVQTAPGYMCVINSNAIIEIINWIEEMMEPTPEQPEPPKQ